MKVTKEELLAAIEGSSSMSEAGAKLPINFKTFITYAKRLNVYTTNQSGRGISKPQPKIDLEDILIGNQPQYKTYKLKLRLFKERGWEHVCSSCELTDWLGQPIPLELDHIDGNPYNHIETNLRLLCPNCHAQTPTYRSKKRIAP